MKYTFLILLFVLPPCIQAQNPSENQVLTNKNGKHILPEPGDWAIGISADPFLYYFGNFFSNDFSYAPSFTSINPGTLFGKYHLPGGRALRMGLNIGITNSTEKIGNPLEANEYDKETVSALSIGLMAGLEKYKSFGSRLRGYYGMDAGVSKFAFNGYHYQSLENVRGKYEFKDAVTSSNDFVEKGGNSYSLEAKAIVGVEYFFAPKISLSGEFGAGLRGTFTTDRKYMPANDPEVIFNPGGHEISVFTNTSSMIRLFFYF